MGGNEGWKALELQGMMDIPIDFESETFDVKFCKSKPCICIVIETLEWTVKSGCLPHGRSHEGAGNYTRSDSEPPSPCHPTTNP